MHNIDWQIDILYKHIKPVKNTGKTPEDTFVDLCRGLFAYWYKNMPQEALLDFHWNLDKGEDIQASFTMKTFSRIYDRFINSGLRERTGSYYTPDYIIRYMVEDTLIAYLERSTGIERNRMIPIVKSDPYPHDLSRKDLLALQQALKHIKIIDIACGTGLFLIAVFEKIYLIRKRIYLYLGINIEHYFLKKEILEENIYGMDIQEQPLEIAKYVLLSLAYDETPAEQRGHIELNLRKANSLVEEKIFQQKWSYSFDVVMGNPPYLGEKGNRNVFQEIRNTSFGRKYYEGKMDYFYFFIYRGLELLKDKGLLNYITTNYFVTADGASKLRNYLKNHTEFLQIVNFNHAMIFPDAKGQHNMIFLLSKGREEKGCTLIKSFRDQTLTEEGIEKRLYYTCQGDESVDVFKLYPSQLFTSRNHIVLQGTGEEQYLLKKIEETCDQLLEDICHVNQGIVTGADKVTKNMLEKKLTLETIFQYGIRENDGIFVLNEAEVLSLGLETSPFLKPMFKNSDILGYRAKEITDKYILYVNDLHMLHQTPEEYERIQYHLLKYKEVLQQRREVLKGLRAWYAIQWPRRPEIFEKAKIVAPHRARENRFAYIEVPWYASADVYFITPKRDNVNYKTLLAQLNSNIMYFWLYHRGKRKGLDLELYANPLKGLPIFTSIKGIDQTTLEHNVDRLLKKNCTESRKKIDICLYKIYGLLPNEIQKIEALCNENRKYR